MNTSASRSPKRPPRKGGRSWKGGLRSAKERLRAGAHAPGWRRAFWPVVRAWWISVVARWSWSAVWPQGWIIARWTCVGGTNFNTEPLPRIKAEAVACLGLLEYLYDVPSFMRGLRKLYGICVVSYCVTDAPAPLSPPRAHAWVNDYDQATLNALFVSSGWRVDRRQFVDASQVMWKLT